jgi:hypothetical protein
MADTLSIDRKPETSIASPMSVLRIRNFRLLWIGEGISLLGDQFYMIALPWRGSFHFWNGTGFCN